MVQSYKAACRGLLKALGLLHDKGLVHRGMSAANLVWSDSARSSVILVALDMACKVDTVMPEHCRLPEWDGGTLDTRGGYGKASDICETGKLLRYLALFEEWEESAAGFCNMLIGKQLTASGALGHYYLAR